MCGSRDHGRFAPGCWRREGASCPTGCVLRRACEKCVRRRCDQRAFLQCRSVVEGHTSWFWCWAGSTTEFEPCSFGSLTSVCPAVAVAVHELWVGHRACRLSGLVGRKRHSCGSRCAWRLETGLALPLMCEGTCGRAALASASASCGWGSGGLILVDAPRWNAWCPTEAFVFVSFMRAGGSCRAG